jgi:hypothetical protein
VGVTVRVVSSPPGALVLVSPSQVFDESAAIDVGRTPLLRWIAMPAIGTWRVQVSRHGCTPWEGALTAAAPALRVELACDLASGAPPMPLERMRVRLIAGDLREIDGGLLGESETEASRALLVEQLGAALAERHAERVVLEPDWSDEVRGDWRALAEEVSQLRGDKVPYYAVAPSVPRRILPAGPESADEAVLFAEVLAFVPSSAQEIQRFLMPLALTLGSVLSGSPLVSVYGPGARPHLLSAHLIGVRGGNGEVLLLDGIRVAGAPTDARATGQLAHQVAAAVPKAWFADP